MFKITFKLFALIIIATMFACTNNNKNAKPPEAVKVNNSKTNDAITFNKIKEGSFMDWRAAHLGGIDPRLGKIYFKEANIEVNNGKISSAIIIIDMDKMTVENLPADGAKNLIDHLKTEDFFDVKKHPTSTFNLKKVENTSGKYNSKITGDLTILETSKSITFNANINVSKNEVSVQSEDFIINRSDWGLTYNAEGTAGVPLDYLISDDVGFTINITVVK